MLDSKITWAVGLSDGSNAYEGKGQFKRVKGALSPWQRLLTHLDKSGLEITSLSLHADGMRWTLPSKGKNPKFRAFDDAPKPNDYRYFRKMGADGIGGQVHNEEFYVVIEAEYDDHRLQIWVLDKEPYPSWSLVVWKTSKTTKIKQDS